MTDLCDCCCADLCPLGRVGSQARCSRDELRPVLNDLVTIARARDPQGATIEVADIASWVRHRRRVLHGVAGLDSLIAPLAGVGLLHRHWAAVREPPIWWTVAN